MDRNFMDYISALNEAHNQMLEFIQDGRTQMIILEQNPLHSQDAMFGVPQLFQEILNEILYCARFEDENGYNAMLADSKKKRSQQSYNNQKSQSPLSHLSINDIAVVNHNSPMIP